MTDLQRFYFTMFKAVEAGLTKYQLVWQNNSIVSANVTLLRAYIQDINAINLKRMYVTTGITKTANDLRTTLNSEVFRMKEALKIYYGINNLSDDERMFTYAKSKLVRMTKNDFYVAMMGIIDRATPLQAQLAPMGITPQKLTTLTQDAAKYYQLIFFKNDTFEQKKGYTATLAKKINDCRLMLRNKMDSIMGTFEMNEPEMCWWYKNSRRIIRTGGKRNYYTVIISGKITDSATKLPLAGVNITCETKGKPAVSDDMGKYTVKMYKKKAKAIVLKLEGYDDLRFALPAELKEHKMKVDLKMKPLSAIAP